MSCFLTVKNLGCVDRRRRENMNRTKIDYLDWSWNPIAMRCTHVSAGCANC